MESGKLHLYRRLYPHVIQGCLLFFDLDLICGVLRKKRESTKKRKSRKGNPSFASFPEPPTKERPLFVRSPKLQSRDGGPLAGHLRATKVHAPPALIYTSPTPRPLSPEKESSSISTSGAAAITISALCS